MKHSELTNPRLLILYVNCSIKSNWPLLALRDSLGAANGFVFTSKDTFEHMIAGEKFLEYVQVFGDYYGTPRLLLQEAQENGNDLIIKVDERGVAQIKQELPDAVSILVLHSSRGQPVTGSIVNERLLNQRLRDASQKLDPDKFDHVVSHDRVHENANRVAAIIRSERSRRS